MVLSEYRKPEISIDISRINQPATGFRQQTANPPVTTHEPLRATDGACRAVMSRITTAFLHLLPITRSVPITKTTNQTPERTHCKPMPDLPVTPKFPPLPAFPQPDGTGGTHRIPLHISLRTPPPETIGNSSCRKTADTCQKEENPDCITTQVLHCSSFICANPTSESMPHNAAHLFLSGNPAACADD